MDQCPAILGGFTFGKVDSRTARRKCERSQIQRRKGPREKDIPPLACVFSETAVPRQHGPISLYELYIYFIGYLLVLFLSYYTMIRVS